MPESMMVCIEKYSKELQLLVGPAPRPAEGRILSEEHELLEKAANAVRTTPAVMRRLIRQLRYRINKQKGDDSPPKPPADPPTRQRVPTQRFEPPVAPEDAPDPLDWQLQVHTSDRVAVPIDGPPVHLLYRGRRSPAGFRDAVSFLAQLGDGSSCVFKRRRGSMAVRPAKIMVIASRRSGARAANPMTQEWQDITSTPRVACSSAAYVKVYYGGDDAAKLEKLINPRLPTNLSLRGNGRSLMFFVSVTESNSKVHFDETPSVLIVLCGTRTVWLAPHEVKEKCGLQHFTNHPHILKFDPSRVKTPHPAWICVVLQQGQGVFIPRRWWHVVLASAGSIGMSLEVTPSDITPACVGLWEWDTRRSA